MNVKRPYTIISASLNLISTAASAPAKLQKHAGHFLTNVQVVMDGVKKSMTSMVVKFDIP